MLAPGAFLGKAGGKTVWRHLSDYHAYKEAEVGTTIQPAEKLEIKNYIAGYLSDASRDIMRIVEEM